MTADLAPRVAESRPRHRIRLWLSVALPVRWRGEGVRRGRRAFRACDSRQDSSRRRAGWFLCPEDRKAGVRYRFGDAHLRTDIFSY